MGDLGWKCKYLERSHSELARLGALGSQESPFREDLASVVGAQHGFQQVPHRAWTWMCCQLASCVCQEPPAKGSVEVVRSRDSRSQLLVHDLILLGISCTTRASYYTFLALSYTVGKLIVSASWGS